MPKTVLYYTDRYLGDHQHELKRNIRADINHKLEADQALHVNARSVEGFESGVNWGELRDKEGAIAVVIYAANDACVLGVSMEARDAGLDAYEFVDGKLWKIGGTCVFTKDEVEFREVQEA